MRVVEAGVMRTRELGTVMVIDGRIRAMMGMVNGLGMRVTECPIVVGDVGGQRIGANVVVDLESVARRAVRLIVGTMTWSLWMREVRSRGRGRGFGSVVVAVASRLRRPGRWSVHDLGGLTSSAGCDKCRSCAIARVPAKASDSRCRSGLRRDFISPRDARRPAVTDGLAVCQTLPLLYAAGATCATGLAFSWRQSSK